MKYAFLILTGGEGSRLFPLTKDFPKPYLPIYFNDSNIYRMIDIPINFCKKHDIPIYVAIDYHSEKLDYLKDVPNLKFIYTRCDNLCKALKTCLKVLDKDNINYYSVYAGDFLIPEKVILKMMKYMFLYDKVILCSKNSSYSKFKVDDNLTDLTFHINGIKNGLKTFAKYNSLNDTLKLDNGVRTKKLVSKINDIDMGTPSAYYEVLKKFNKAKIDKNGNIVFPNATINENSKNVIALPNSYSENIILNNAIVPENCVVTDLEDVLKIDDISSDYFDNIKIKNYIRR